MRVEAISEILCLDFEVSFIGDTRKEGNNYVERV